MANHRKKPIDPSKPLPNPKYEKMAHALVAGKSQTEAYLEANPKASIETARANASPTVEIHGINARALALLNKVGLTEEKLANKLNEHVDSTTESISMDATKTGFKLLGYGQESKLAETSYNPTQINIIIKQRDTQPIDTIDVTSNDGNV